MHLCFIPVSQENKSRAMNYIYAVALVFFLGFNSSSQDLGKIEGANARLFQVVENNDTINFIKIDADISKKKPVLIMLQGSLPIPLGVRYPEGVSFTSFPFNLEKEMLDQYHIVAISMPEIPPIVDVDDIAPNGTIKNIPSEYNKRNYLEHYVNRANDVVNFLRKQDWVEVEKFILFGHSQGCYVAIKLAAMNPQISRIGIASCSPFGRYEQYLSKVRSEEQTGVLTSIEAQNKIEEYYNRWKHISHNRFDDSQERGDTFKATYSFSENFVDDIIGLQIPLYITYGTKDIGALGCDYLPIVLESASKKDYVLKAYAGLGHNFEEVDQEGNSNYNKMYWDRTFTDFIDWALGE